MAVYGAVRIGRATLTENWQVADKDGAQGRSLSLSGQEASPALSGSQATTRDRAEALMAYRGAVVPVVFTHQPHRNGWYRVGAPSADEDTWNEFTVVRWRVDLERLGRDSEAEVESRLSSGVGGRTHASAAVADFWHAPAVGADTYLTGTGSPGHVDRTGADGVVRVFRAIPAGTHPRWAVPAASAVLGAATVTVNGSVRTGTTCDDTPATWALSNGLLRVEPRASTGTLLLTSYLTSGWGTAKAFDLRRGATSLGPAQHVTILRNDLCEVVVRLTWDHSPGRTVADLTLTRGSRFVGLFIQQYAVAAALIVDDDGAASGTISDDNLTSAGYIAGSADDVDGNRWVIGSTVACATHGTLGITPNVAAAALPAYIGVVRAGASAVSGDTAAHLNAQYLGTPAQADRVVKR